MIFLDFEFTRERVDSEQKKKLCLFIFFFLSAVDRREKSKTFSKVPPKGWQVGREQWPLFSIGALLRGVLDFSKLFENR